MSIMSINFDDKAKSRNFGGLTVDIDSLPGSPGKLTIPGALGEP